MSKKAKPRSLTRETFESEVLQSSQPIVVDFWADWCGPCRTMAPAVERLTREYEGRVTVAKVNVDEEPDLARAYGIRSIPSFLLFDGGEVVDRLAGAVPIGLLVERIEKVLSEAA